MLDQEAPRPTAEIEPMNAAEMAALVKRVFDAPADVVEAARKVMGAL